MSLTATATTTGTLLILRCFISRRITTFWRTTASIGASSGLSTVTGVAAARPAR